MPRRRRGGPPLRRPRAPSSSLFAALLAAWLLAACGGATPATITIEPATAGSQSPGATATLGLPSPGLSGGGSPAATVSGPSATAPAASLSTSPTTPPTVSPSTSPAPGERAGCTGSADNQAFFGAVAGGVSWTVYCAVLPAGWYLQQGRYELDGGGQMTVTYQGPGGVHLQLQEGAFCSGGASACAPHDAIVGPTAYGDRSGELMTLAPGYAVYVSPGEPPSWAAASVDLDEATFVRLVADLVPVARP